MKMFHVGNYIYYYIYNSMIVEYLIMYGLQLLKANKMYWVYHYFISAKVKRNRKIKREGFFWGFEPISKTYQS